MAILMAILMAIFVAILMAIFEETLVNKVTWEVALMENMVIPFCFYVRRLLTFYAGLILDSAQYSKL